MKKVVLINHSDTRGGASVVTYRLMQALSRAGVDARMIVMHKGTDSLRVAQAASPNRTRLSFLAECAQIYLNNGFNRRDLFKVSTASFGLPLHKHPWVRAADAVILGWINQGMMSLSEIQRISDMRKPIAWTLHDMWPITGICHHAGTCNRFTDGCGNCPFIRGGKSVNDLSRTVWRRKQRIYRNVPLKFVAIGSWIAGKCTESGLTAAHDVVVIPNAFPVDEYRVTPRKSRGELGLPAGKRLIVMGAARLDDPIKNLPLAVDALNRVGADADAAAVFFGNIRDPYALDGLRMPHVALGPVSDPADVAQIYAHADVVLSTSRYETLPGTLIEGMAAGAVPVSTGNGGQRDIIDNGIDGYIAHNADDPDEIAVLIERAIANPFPRDAQHEAVKRRFDARRIANAYIQLLDLQK